MSLKDLKQPIRVRRGTDAQRVLVTFALGEMVFTTDTHRLYVGDGSTAGGIHIGGAPDAHAASHASAGSDPITPASIGAAAASHTQAIGTITGLQAALDAKVASSVLLAQNAAAPAISGSTQVGQTLTGSDGTWTEPLTTTSTDYQWQRNDGAGGAWQDIAGATAVARLLDSSDLGFQLRVGVRKTNPVGTSGWTFSDATAVVTQGEQEQHRRIVNTSICEAGSGWSVGMTFSLDAGYAVGNPAFAAECTSADNGALTGYTVTEAGNYTCEQGWPEGYLGIVGGGGGQLNFEWEVIP